MEDPMSDAIRAELSAMNNRLIEIEDDLVRVMRREIAGRLGQARGDIFTAIAMMRQTSERLQEPF